VGNRFYETYQMLPKAFASRSCGEVDFIDVQNRAPGLMRNHEAQETLKLSILLEMIVLPWIIVIWPSPCGQVTHFALPHFFLLVLWAPS
jgi:hypothetical protein